MIYVTRNYFNTVFFIMVCIVSVVVDVIHGYYYSTTPYYETDKKDPFRNWWYLKSYQPQPKQDEQLLLKQQDGDNEKVKIQVYYETLCPFSIAFHTEDFNTTVNQLGSYLDFQTYPYGNAKTNINKDGKVNIECQHGPTECYGNMLHACVIDTMGMTTSAVIYNSCMMSWSQSNGRSDDNSADKCGEILGVNSEAIKACAKGDKGIKLLNHYGVETKKAKKSSVGVPYVLLNGQEFDTDNNLKKAVCQAFRNQPLACHENFGKI